MGIGHALGRADRVALDQAIYDFCATSGTRFMVASSLFGSLLYIHAKYSASVILLLSIECIYTLLVELREVPMKTEAILIRAEPEEKQAFRLAADLAGVPLSAWMRERLRRAARLELVDAGQRVPFFKPQPETL